MILLTCKITPKKVKLSLLSPDIVLMEIICPVHNKEQNAIGHWILCNISEMSYLHGFYIVGCFSLGVLLSRLESKLLEIRSYHINWESYQQGEMISSVDCQFISYYDKQSLDGKKQVFEKDPEQVPNFVYLYYDCYR